MIKSGAYAGAEHGKSARTHLFLILADTKAAPGFSNHSDGNAVDFKTFHDGVRYEANRDQRAAWRTTWFYKWLLENGPQYGFKQLKTEEWHWDFQ